MGRINRLKRITMARIESFLDSIERPEDVLPQLMEEMQERLTEAVNAEAKALGAAKAERQRFDAVSGRVSRLQSGAKLAVVAKDFETARQAIAAQIEAEKNVKICEQVLSTAESAYQSARQVREQLQNALKDLKARRDQILSRARLVKQKQRLSKVLGSGGGSILDAVARMDAKVYQAEAQIEVRNEISQTLGVAFHEERVEELERDAEVDRRLEELKHQLGCE